MSQGDRKEANENERKTQQSRGNRVWAFPGWLSGREKENRPKGMVQGGTSMKKSGQVFALVAVVMLALSVAACSSRGSQSKQWVVGFSQIGSESEWRTADTISVQNAFLEDPSFTLIYSDAQQRQENQIKALRSSSRERSTASFSQPSSKPATAPSSKKQSAQGFPWL